MADAEFTLIDRDGWAPYRFGTIGQEAFVDWCFLGDTGFREPFFEGTILRAMQQPFNQLFAHRTTIGELGGWQRSQTPLMPAGFIFHMSRCGSTLVSQALAALPNVTVLSEPTPADRVARALWIPETTRAQWLGWLLGALGRGHGSDSRCVVKFDSCTSIALPFLRQAFPEVPWIFIGRNPEEVLVSQLRNPGPALMPGVLTDVTLVEAPLEEMVAMTPEEYAARGLGRICENAVQALTADAGQRGLYVDYEELPEAMWTRIAQHFGLHLTEQDAGAMKAVTGQDAKSPGRTFESDTAEKRAEALGAPHRAAERWMQPHYDALLAISALRATR